MPFSSVRVGHRAQWGEVRARSFAKQLRNFTSLLDQPSAFGGGQGGGWDVFDLGPAIIGSTEGVGAVEHWLRSGRYRGFWQWTGRT